MTVNELIAELQVLAAQGHGELDVAVYDSEYSEHNIDGIKPQVLQGFKLGDIYATDEDPSETFVPFVSIRY